MKNRIILFLCCICPLFLFSQLEASNWYFGWNAGVSFASGSPIALTDGALHTDEGCSSISDASGNLLFYTDGITVWNRNHQPMPNGTGLLGYDDSTQSGLIVPSPGNRNIYYIFTVDAQAGINGMNYSEVDMDLDGGLGDITSNKNINLIPRSLEKVTAVKNQDGSGIWVIGHPWDSNRFYAYLVTAAGINTVPVESVTPLTLTYPPGTDGTNASVGQLKVSPDGTKLAMCSSTIGSHLFDFDPRTGSVDNMVQISNRGLDYGIEFSPSGNLVYVGSDAGTGMGELYQYDIDAPDIAASEILVASHYSLGFALQLAIDGKIYTIDNGPFLSSIDDPDILGTGCNFNYQSVDLNGRMARAGLPPFIQSYFYVDLDIRNLCFGDVTEFYPNGSGNITSIIWDFGDGNTSSLETPTHVYGTPGDYTVTVTVNTATGSTTDTKEITIHPPPVAHAPTDVEVCNASAPYRFDLSTKDAEVLGTQVAADYGVNYYPTFIDAQNGTNTLPNLYTNANVTETVFARISNVSNPDCYDITSFDLTVKEAPVLHPVTDRTVCDTDADGLYTFDLSEKNREILNGQSDTTFAVRYFGSQADADTNTGALGTNHTNTNSPETIFFRIENTLYPECFETGSFDLGVITAVTANAPAPLEVCDTDNDGIAVFDLSSQDMEVLDGQSPTSFTVTYHTTQMDADSGTDALTASNYTNAVPYSETIYARVGNIASPDCYDTTSFELMVHDSPVRQAVTDWPVCDANNDGTAIFDLNEKNREVLGGQSALGFTITYHENEGDALSGQNPIVGDYQNVGNPQTVYYRLETTANGNCFLTDSFEIQLFDTPMAHRPTPMVACDLDGTGIQHFDLSTKDAEILNGQDATDYAISYFDNEADARSGQNALSRTAHSNATLRQTIYARIENEKLEGCYDLTSFEIIVNPLPDPGLGEVFVICPDSPELTVDGGNFGTWSWRNANNEIIGTDRYLPISELGGYSLTVTRNDNGLDCGTTVSFEVLSSGAPEDFTADIEGFSDRLTLTVDAAGTGDFEYSIDGEHYQDDNRLEVFPGTYTVYVRDRLQCRTISKEVVALGYRKFFTPNGDGTNDYWNIIGAEGYPEAELYVHDRFGKLLAKLKPGNWGWDGTFMGAPMPSSDYWFHFVYGNGMVFKGHFALKR